MTLPLSCACALQWLETLLIKLGFEGNPNGTIKGSKECHSRPCLSCPFSCAYVAKFYNEIKN